MAATKLGIESSPKAMVVDVRSKMPPARWAASRPMGMATASAMNWE